MTKDNKDPKGYVPSRKAYLYMLASRGIAIGDVCDSCAGMGVAVYGDTSTYMHKIGGAALTTDVCEDCWGTGKKSRVGANLRELSNITDAVRESVKSGIQIDGERILECLRLIRPQNRIKLMSDEGSQAEAKPTES